MGCTGYHAVRVIAMYGMAWADEIMGAASLFTYRTGNEGRTRLARLECREVPDVVN